MATLSIVFGMSAVFADGSNVAASDFLSQLNFSAGAPRIRVFAIEGAAYLLSLFFFESAREEYGAFEDPDTALAAAFEECQLSVSQWLSQQSLGRFQGFVDCGLRVRFSVSCGSIKIRWIYALRLSLYVNLEDLGWLSRD